MEYIDFEAEVSNEDEILSFSGSENDEDNRPFTDDGEVENQEPSFYRKFFNRTRDPAEAVYDDDKSHLDTRDLQPEMFLKEDRANVEFDELKYSGKCAEQFKKSLLLFDCDDAKDSFFDAVLYGLY